MHLLVTLEQCLHKLTCLQIDVCDSACVHAWMSNCLFSMWVFVFFVCACHLDGERGTERWKKKERGGERAWRRVGSDYGLEWLGGFAVERFLNSAFLCACRGRISSSTLASARGIEQKKKKGRKKREKTKDVVRTNSLSGLTFSGLLLNSRIEDESFTHPVPASIILEHSFNRPPVLYEACWYCWR